MVLGRHGDGLQHSKSTLAVLQILMARSGLGLGRHAWVLLDPPAEAAAGIQYRVQH